MAKKEKAVVKENPGVEFYAALDALEKERNIPKEYMLEKIKAAIAATVKRDRNVPAECVDVEFNEEKGTMRAFIKRTVVEEIETFGAEVTLDEALKTNPTAQLGDVIEENVDPAAVGRIAAKVGKNVIVQAINEAVNSSVIRDVETHQGEIKSCVVTSVDPQHGTVYVELEQHEWPLYAREQIPGEVFTVGQKLKVYVDVAQPDMKKLHAKEVVLSRSSGEFVRKLFAQEVPEIGQGVVEIKGISREAGSRCKVAVMSNDPNVEAVGSCIGARQSRISAILSNMANERIDLIRYSEDPAQYVVAALSPATAKLMEINTEQRTCRVVVPSESLSLAIGKGGQNVRLAARLTGYKIDIIAQ